jgi:hypothetical protein
MKLSVEAKVAAAVAVAFAALSIGAIAQEGTEDGNPVLSGILSNKSEISLSVQNATAENGLPGQD